VKIDLNEGHSEQQSTMQKTIIGKEQSESYEAVEARIQKAIEYLLESEEKSPNL